MRVFLVLAHPEPKSLNAALARHALEVLEAEGHETIFSDLCAMGFDPVSDRRNFTTVMDPAVFRQQREEVHASERDGFAPDISAEQSKLLSCDALVLQFPLWWAGPPAILKGWVDRVFAKGRTYDDERWYDRGVFAGKRAMLSLTVGGPESVYAPDGLGGDIMEVLFPIHRGILQFNGFEVLPPCITYGLADAGDEPQEEAIERLGERLRALETAEPLLRPYLDEFGPEFRLK